MIAEALKFLHDRFAEGTAAKEKVHLLKIPPTTEGAYLVVGKDGEATRVIPPAPPRNHTLNAVADMQTAIRWAYQDLNQDEGSVLTCWYDRSGAVLVLNDDGDRRDMVRLKLETTPVWDLLKELESDEPDYTHAELIQIIRLKLSPYLGSGELQAILAPLRVLDFGNNSTGQSTQDQHRQGFGKTVDNIVASKAGKIPDEIRISAKIYRDPLLAQNYTVRLILDIDAASETFKLTPYPEDIETAEERATTILGNLLHSYARTTPSDDAKTSVEMCPVFYGRP